MSILARLRGIFGRSAVRQAHSLAAASQDAGAFRGSLKNWILPRVQLRSQAAFERDLTNARVDDLYVNDGVARSGVNAIATNVIGCGLVPQSVIPADLLNLDAETTGAIQDRMEWLWSEWCGQAHYRNQLGFADLQMLGLRSLIRHGEMLHLPVMEERPGCRFALRIQDIRPMRLRTPWDKQFDPYIHDGVEVSETGVPRAYWIASPEPSVAMLDDTSYTSSQFLHVPSFIGHRRGVFHIFRPDGEEQYRGVSTLGAALKFFRHFNDSIDYELLAQVLAASFPVFIGLENGTQDLPSYLTDPWFYL